MAVIQNYEPSQLVNLGISKDTVNDFARKYNLEVERIYDILNKYSQRKVGFTADSTLWTTTSSGAKFSTNHNGNIVYAVYRTENGVDSLVVTGVSMDGTNVMIDADAPFTGYLLLLSANSDRSIAPTISDAELEALREFGQTVIGLAQKDMRFNTTYTHNDDIFVGHIFEAYIYGPSTNAAYRGKIRSSTGRSTYWMQITEDCDVYFDSGTANYVIRVSVEEPVVGYGSNVTWTGEVYSAESGINAENPLHIEAGMYLAFNNGTGTGSFTLHMRKSEQVLKDSLPLTATMKEEVTNAVNKVENRLNLTDTIGLYSEFKNGYWNSSTSVRADLKYRVYNVEAISFDYDVQIMAREDFTIGGYRQNEDGTYSSFNTSAAVKLSKGRAIKLYIRRAVENTSEVADIEEFTSGIIVCNEEKESSYANIKESFFGLEMFRTMGVIGDSYSAIRLGYSWATIVGNKLGIDVRNYAHGGYTAKSWRESSLATACLTEPAKDFYWLALGINDASRWKNNEGYRGSIADLNGSYTNYPDTFYGDYGWIIESIQAHAPYAKMILFKPIFGSANNTKQPTNSTDLPSVRAAIEEIGSHYGIPVIDALDDPFYLSVEYQSHMDYDLTFSGKPSPGNHPSILLYPGIANANQRLFSKCVASHTDYFMNINYNRGGTEDEDGLADS